MGRLGRPGAVRTALGDYLVAFLAAAALCLIAALVTQVVRLPDRDEPAIPEPVRDPVRDPVP